ncbi:MAG: hypothetical protein ACJAVK_002921 [Akkermansiaceae bacterium]|jgi:hypothetical protein
MKTALKFLVLATVITFLIFLNTLTYQKNPKIHPPPKSTRVISRSAKTKTTPFPRLESQAQKLTDQQLRTAIKTEWSKLDQRPNNRELPTLIAHLRERGRRDGLDGLLFLNDLPFSGYPTDSLQAKIAIIAGWGLDDHEEAATFLYTNINLLKEQGTTWLVSPNIMEKALELAEYEIQARWVHEDSEGFLAMLYQSDSGFPVNPARRAKVHERFPQLLNPSQEAGDTDPFEPALNAAPGITPRSETRYFENFGGNRASSTLEWAARNPDLARQLIEPTGSKPNAPTFLFEAEDIPEIIGGLSLKNPDYQALLDLAPPTQRLAAIENLINLADTHHTEEVWPVDGRPAPTQLSQSERAEAIKSILQTDRTIPEDLRKYYLKALEKSILRSHPTE